MAKSKKRNSSHSVLFTAVLIIVVLIVISAAALYIVRPDIYHKYLGIGEHTYENGVCTVCGKSEPSGGPATGTPAEVENSEFSIHVIDLGEHAGDSIYIKAGENDILIDAGATGGSASLICTYLNKYVTDGKLEYVIATHADTDHIAAFAGNSSGSTRTGVLYNFKVDTLIKFDNVEGNKKENENKPNTVYGKFCAAVKHAEENGAKVYTAGQCYKEEGGAKRQYWLDEEHTLSMNILYNYYYYNVSGDENNHSVVTLFTKETTSKTYNFLLTGDLEKDGESRMVDYYANSSNSKSRYDVLPDVDFYKAGHHGSGTSSTEKLLNVIKPEYVAISCCAGTPEYTTDVNNTFPYTAVFRNLLKYTQNIYCTSVADTLPSISNGQFSQKGGGFTGKPWNGDIVCFFNRPSDGGGEDGVKLWCSGSPDTVLTSDWYKTYRKNAVEQ